MARIRIISTPAGQAPEWVRQQWVGLELPITDEEVAYDAFTEEQRRGEYKGALGGAPEPENMGGFHVQTRKVIEALSEKSLEAANWWKKNVPLSAIDHLVFGRKFCEIIP